MPVGLEAYPVGEPVGVTVFGETVGDTVVGEDVGEAVGARDGHGEPSWVPCVARGQ
eukprot:CAMPEP_0114247062 /NCGR_PEP_ID=MMETSP0058-20121206/12817_1 /TAXON_ID=36894 /ORGANISM="Pyramimonas parkeae, CCMP726" /LENGTH=55 /DNA_ID=CAMNT_0001360333 /DNA_START=1509 /DNA_END=1676 /DNA_ORIENTATION=+